jgi:hypothetical protein
MEPREESLAVILFVYNRPAHTRAVLQGLAATGVVKIHVFQDGLRQGHDPGTFMEVTDLIQKISFCEVIFKQRAENLGLAKSIIGGVSEILKDFETVLVLEDDCVPSPALLGFIRFCLARFSEDFRVFSICGFGLPTFPKDYPYDACFSPLASSWGWATWRNRWNRFDPAAEGWRQIDSDRETRRRFNLPGPRFSDMLGRQMRGEIDSWAIRWYLTHFRAEAVCLYPLRSYIQNIGNDGSGVHSDPSDAFEVAMNSEFNPDTFRFPPTFEFDPKIRVAFNQIYNPLSGRRLFSAFMHPSNWPRLFVRAFKKIIGACTKVR